LEPTLKVVDLVSTDGSEQQDSRKENGKKYQALPLEFQLAQVKVVLGL